MAPFWIPIVFLRQFLFLVLTFLACTCLVEAAEVSDDPESLVMDYLLDTGPFSRDQDPLNRIHLVGDWLVSYKRTVLNQAASMRQVRGFLLLSWIAEHKRAAMTSEFLATSQYQVYRAHPRAVVQTLHDLPWLAVPVCRDIGKFFVSEWARPDGKGLDLLRRELSAQLLHMGASEASRDCSVVMQHLLQSESTNSL